MEVPSAVDYNSLCEYYSNLVDTSQPVVYLVYKGDFCFYTEEEDEEKCFHTQDKEKALSYVNTMIAVYLKEAFVEVETPLQDTNETIVCEVRLERGEDRIILKVIEVSALKDTSGSKPNPFVVEGRLYFYVLRLNKETIYRGYTPFLGDADFVREHAAKEFMRIDTGPKYIVIPWRLLGYKLKVVDQLRPKTHTLFFYPKTLPPSYIKNDYQPVFEFCRVDTILKVL